MFGDGEDRDVRGGHGVELLSSVKLKGRVDSRSPVRHPFQVTVYHRLS
uniref:Uncharacterized protein n=1 Tax=Anguilla anguilla TaxID=7936 RepID=A0A0E9SGR4_ANGAN